jgi:hypothetical protein
MGCCVLKKYSKTPYLLDLSQIWAIPDMGRKIIFIVNGTIKKSYSNRACARTVAVAVGPCSEWVFAARGCGHSNRKHFWSLNQSESSGVMRLLPQPVGPGESPKGINSWLMAKEATAVSRAATHHTSFGPGSPDSISVLWYVSFSFRPRHHLW